MSKTAFTIRIYSFYLFLMGAGMIIIPNILLSLFGFPNTTEIWIRMLGLFTFTTGIYYFYSSAHEQTAFYKSTVVGRLFFFVMTIVFVFVFKQSIMLAAIGSIDCLGAIWTLTQLKKAFK
jgi:hypothetical protein